MLQGRWAYNNRFNRWKKAKFPNNRENFEVTLFMP